MPLTQDQVKNATGSNSTNAAKFLQHINDTCDKYAISTPVQQLCFLAQMGHESGGLFYTEELASGSAYEGRADLGNTQPGDGVKYKGRGLIQITGRANYTKLSTDLGVDFVANPTALGGKNANSCTDQQLHYSALSAGWYWGGRKLNDIAATIDLTQPIDAGANLDAFRKITKIINGGYNGLPDRLSRYKAGVASFQ